MGVNGITPGTAFHAAPGFATLTRMAQDPSPFEQTKARLAARLREINDEIRAYPQPIARCDAQLGGLVEERARIRAQLAEIEARAA